MHLEWIEVLLVIKHVTYGLSLLLDLSKLNEEHVIELSKVLLHVIYGNALTQLVENCLNTTIELALQLADFSIVVLIGLGVLFKPVLAIGEYLVHSAFQVVITGVILEELIPHIDD